MSREWQPEQEIEASIALQVIQEQFPEVSAKTIRLLASGWDNTAFVINDEMIFRFPRRTIALALLEAEWCALRKLAPFLPLPIPVPNWKGSPSLHFPWVFIGYKMLEGTTACEAHLSESERTSLAIPIAKFLQGLHSVDTSVLSSCHIPNDNKSRIDASILIPKIKKNLEELSSLGLIANKKHFFSLIDRFDSFREPTSSVVVHGDFYVRHLLVGQDRQLSGVIDWGDIHLGDPAIDLAIAHSFLPVKAHDLFLQAYSGITKETWQLAKIRALFSASMISIFGHHSKDFHLLREGLQALHALSAG